MITDFDRNVRTLIVSFVIAIMVLIPLRFYEAGQEEMGRIEEVRILGATTEIKLSPTPTMVLFDAPWNR